MMYDEISHMMSKERSTNHNIPCSLYWNPDRYVRGMTIFMTIIKYMYATCARKRQFDWFVRAKVGPVKRIWFFEHSVMTNFNCACPAIQGARDLAFCLKVCLDLLLVWASSGGSGETARMRRLAWTFAARICDKYQIRLTRSKCSVG